MQRTLRTRLGTLALASLLLGSAACGDDSADAPDAADDSSAPAVDTESEAAGMVPDDIREAGKLVIGTDASYAPNEFFAEDGSTIVGMDIDLFDAVAAEMGLKTEYQNADFGTIIGGVTGGKYDLGVSSFTINEERKGQVNMVSYFNAGTQWAVASGNPEDVDPESPCGLTVAVQANTVQDQEDLPPKVEACEAQGSPLTVQQYEGQDQATSALVTGKADAMLADSPVVSYAISQVGGDIESVGDISDAAPYGYVVPMEDTDLADALVVALEAVAEDGSYDEALQEWGQSQGAIADFAVNP
ncbi:MAG: ABC transporter substrate-binding protein [Ornithinimicrobium sp.]|jgi:polar amino acid transport system substrate-binding protein|uniref:ABC transporter substrate-binding protein n=1 Tax=Ornithinimicrobium sp. TaxID=1977084 RepID=UPI003D9BA846